MRKFFFILAVLFLVPLVSADCVRNFAKDCIPDSGYDHCYTVSWTCGEATSLAEIQHTNVLGTYKSGYFVGNSYINIKYEGDKGYWHKNLQSWDDLNCDGVGCYGGNLLPSNPFKLILTDSPGESFLDPIAFYAWDRDDDSGWWTYSVAGHGWVGDFNMNVKQVECYDDSDCSDDLICDKSTEWYEWSCIEKPFVCEEGAIRCLGLEYQFCENNEWIISGTTLGYCGVECFASDLSLCAPDRYVDSFCQSLTTIIERNLISSCEYNKCVQTLVPSTEICLENTRCAITSQGAQCISTLINETEEEIEEEEEINETDEIEIEETGDTDALFEINGFGVTTEILLVAIGVFLMLFVFRGRRR